MFQPDWFNLGSLTQHKAVSVLDLEGFPYHLTYAARHVGRQIKYINGYGAILSIPLV